MKWRFVLPASAVIVLGFVISCSKGTNPSPPIHDTTVIVKTDTLVVPPSPDSTVNLKMGLLLYLNFNGSIVDSSGNNNPTEVIGGNVLTTDAHGWPNSAFGGNGNGQEIKVTNNGSIQFDTAFSLSYDFMINTNQSQVFLSMVQTADGYGPSFLSSASDPGSQYLNFFANDVSASCDAIGPSQVQNPKSVVDTTIIPLVNTWYNVINIYHKGSIQTYINGQRVSNIQGAGTAVLLCPASQVVIGGWWDSYPTTLNGKMDEVRIYNRVLTPHEIVALSQYYQVTSEKVNPKVVHGN